MQDYNTFIHSTKSGLMESDLLTLIIFLLRFRACHPRNLSVKLITTISSINKRFESRLWNFRVVTHLHLSSHLQLAQQSSFEIMTSGGRGNWLPVDTSKAVQKRKQHQDVTRPVQLDSHDRRYQHDWRD
jgi:hypothetical protein